jgi:hypothetical protein
MPVIYRQWVTPLRPFTSLHFTSLHRHWFALFGKPCLSYPLASRHFPFALPSFSCLEERGDCQPS